MVFSQIAEKTFRTLVELFPVPGKSTFPDNSTINKCFITNTAGKTGGIGSGKQNLPDSNALTDFA